MEPNNLNTFQLGRDTYSSPSKDAYSAQDASSERLHEEGEGRRDFNDEAERATHDKYSWDCVY